MAQNKEKMEQWQDLKFGMFIHWGLYSLVGKGEWVMYNEPIDVDTYAKLKDNFTAEKFNACSWAEVAKGAGMKYMVFTTRHHDGFSLWDSQSSYGNYTSMNSVAKKDFVKDFTQACRDKGLMTGLYYSPMDWRFPGYFLPQLYKNNAQEMINQCHNQVEELLENYGEIDILWYDGGEDYWLCHGRNLHKEEVRPDDFRTNPQVENFWNADKLDKTARKLQPEIIINNRTGARQYGDFITVESKIGEFNIDEPWENCYTLTPTWGWTPDSTMLTLRQCIHLLVTVVVRGGNLLLNVGPRPDGTIEPDQVERLKEIGEWLDTYGESIYETKGGPLPSQEWGGMTWKDNILYIHVLDWPTNTIKFPAPKANIMNVKSLTGDDILLQQEKDTINLSVNKEQRGKLDHIFVLELDKRVDQAYESINYIGNDRFVNDALIVEDI